MLVRSLRELVRHRWHAQQTRRRWKERLEHERMHGLRRTRHHHALLHVSLLLLLYLMTLAQRHLRVGPRSNFTWHALRHVLVAAVHFGIVVDVELESGRSCERRRRRESLRADASLTLASCRRHWLVARYLGVQVELSFDLLV